MKESPLGQLQTDKNRTYEHKHAQNGVIILFMSFAKTPIDDITHVVLVQISANGIHNNIIPSTEMLIFPLVTNSNAISINMPLIEFTRAPLTTAFARTSIGNTTFLI